MSKGHWYPFRKISEASRPRSGIASSKNSRGSLPSGSVEMNRGTTCI